MVSSPDCGSRHISILETRADKIQSWRIEVSLPVSLKGGENEDKAVEQKTLKGLMMTYSLMLKGECGKRAKILISTLE